MDGGHEAKASQAAEAMWRSFFREYLRAVSNIVPQIGPLASLVDSEFDSFERNDAFRKVFIKRSGVETDYRKYQEFVNLVRAFARLCGASSVDWNHLDEASELFRKSLQTLTHDFPIDLVNAQIDPNLIQKHHIAITRFPEPVSLKDVRAVGIKLSDEDVSRLAAIQAIQRFSDGDISNKEILVFQPRSDWKFDEEDSP
jgi:hypothetical protein